MRTNQKQHSTNLTRYEPNAPRLRKAPILHERFLRPCNAGVVTSSFGGKLVPLTAIGLQREDGMRASQFQLGVQMAETANMLINPVRITARAFFAPRLALPRFADMGTIDRSFNGQTELDGSVVPWFEPLTGVPTEIETIMGLHDSVRNDDYIQAYNMIWNHLATQASPSLAHREPKETDLAPAFWSNSNMKYVKPTFDDALMEGQIPISFTTGGDLPVKSVGASRFVDSAPYAPTNNDPTGQPPTDASGNFDWTSTVWAEMQAGDVNISLASIQQARETQAWSRLRTQFQGYSEEWMIDQLLSGIRVRDEDLRQPIELDLAETVVGMSERYATDAENLDKSVTAGQTSLMLNAALPPITTGGVFMIVAQALPEMLYERQRDYYNAAQTVEDLPNRTSDELDPQPVEMVTEQEVDSSSSTDDLFGYRPLNAKWIKRSPLIGGRYYRPDPSAAWDEDRNRIWTPDVVDPKLGPDFYLSNQLSHDVFVSQTEDPFEWWLNGIASIEGLTYFGPALREGTDDYDAITAQVPNDRLKGDGTDTPPVPPA